MTNNRLTEGATLMARCEDYPCCGHTDGLPCDWTYTEEAKAYDMAHAFCEHEAGYCQVADRLAAEQEDLDYDNSTGGFDPQFDTP